MDFQEIWSKILKHQNEVFYTRRRLELSYKIDGDILYHNRTSPEIHKSDFKRAYEKFPIKNPSDIKDLVRGSAYIYAILNDKRITGIQ